MPRENHARVMLFEHRRVEPAWGRDSQLHGRRRQWQCRRRKIQRYCAGSLRRPIQQDRERRPLNRRPGTVELLSKQDHGHFKWRVRQKCRRVESELTWPVLVAHRLSASSAVVLRWDCGALPSRRSCKPASPSSSKRLVQRRNVRALARAACGSCFICWLRVGLRTRQRVATRPASFLPRLPVPGRVAWPREPWQTHRR